MLKAKSAALYVVLEDECTDDSCRVGIGENCNEYVDEPEAISSCSE
jgi:hypothetical protein